MKITYTGQAAFSPAQRRKLDAKFAKLSRLLDRRGEKEAHVILTTERHLHRAEITVHYYDHPLVGLVSSPDTLQAVMGAVEKLEKQILKLHEKWRDTKRTPAAKTWTAREPQPVRTAGDAGGKRVYRVNHQSRRKPMTLDEAILDLDQGQDYTVYRDAETDRVHVLVKRRDGHFDLIEG
ncbi:MAG: HPF/RaiA family ribosome-associated protein [Acidobacteria bacterium]|nr:HPF/RaiA family ribosome-associated protein [Acidobacteriota bacterium]